MNFIHLLLMSYGLFLVFITLYSNSYFYLINDVQLMSKRRPFCIFCKMNLRNLRRFS